ncbi:heterokaryon incompatibility protein-domain-containing protein, partial [Dactylonectria estremocensis]
MATVPEIPVSSSRLGYEDEVNFCSRCRVIVADVTPSESLDDKYRTHHFTAQDLDLAAKAGCMFCRRIADKIWWRSGGSRPPGSTVLSSVGGSSDEFTWYSWSDPKVVPEVDDVSIFVNEPVDTLKGRESCMLRVAFDPLLDQKHFPATIATNNLGSDTSWEQATSWLVHCLENHKSCVHQYSGPWYPTRLINVGKPGDSTVNLCLTATSNMDGPYITLSHRWGLGEMVKLKSGNLQQYLHEIPLTDLPQTFTDAIQVARSLQVRYIWIDSLCIIQDSAEDWLVESAQMQNVYRRSFLNISATGAGDSSGNGALFRHRSLDAGWVAWTTERRKGQRFLVYDREYWNDQLIDSELNRRAWVLQERMLAPRVLHSGDKQLFWECHELEACESKRNMNLGPRIKPGPPLDAKTDLAYELWAEIVSRYTPCSVTKESDKLVAISGIARQLSTTLQDEYLAGLWRSNLVECLSWIAQNPEGLSRPTVYRAPSWSWASVASSVRYFHFGVPQVAEPQVTIEQVCVTPESGDYFGQIRDGFVKLRGSM